MGRKTIANWNNKRDRVVQKIITLTVLGYSARFISKTLKNRCSHELIRQRIIIMKKRWPESFNVKKEEWTSADVAESLHCEKTLVNHLCHTKQITGCRKCNTGNSKWLITNEGKEQLLRHPRISRTRTCVECSAEFQLEEYHSTKQTCSPACTKVHYDALRTKLITTDPNPKNLKGKALKIWRAVRRYKSEHVWVTIKEATQKTRLSPMQVRWYVMRKIIASTHDTIKISKKTGKGVILCDLRQVRRMERILAP